MKMTGKTQSEIDVQDLADRRKARRLNIRQAMRDESDELFFEYEAGEISKDDWLDKRAEIKARFPKK